MNRKSRAEIRRLALRAAGRVALLSVVGCGAGTAHESGTGQASVLEALGDTGLTGPRVEPRASPRKGVELLGDPEPVGLEPSSGEGLEAGQDVSTSNDTSPVDAGSVADAGGAEDARAIAGSDAGLGAQDAGAHCSRDGDWVKYLDCCAAVGWDPRMGCSAWGPPVPPAMEGVA